jgi:hypothetical protein
MVLAQLQRKVALVMTALRRQPETKVTTVALVAVQPATPVMTAPETANRQVAGST